MKTITVRIHGGLGNQMHAYAFGRAVALRNQASLKLDTASGFWSDPFGREYLLDRFPAISTDEFFSGAKTRAGRFVFKCVLRLGILYGQRLPVSRRPVIVETAPWRYQAAIHHAQYTGNPYFIGYWASYRYYEDLERELRRELKPPAPKSPDACEMLSRIQSCRSCCIHWRSYKEDTKTDYCMLDEYYRLAVKQMLEKYPDVVFFVFSDDPAGAKKVIALPEEQCVYVDLPMAEKNEQSLADFYLMFMCDHAIIGNSTFSWWAAWLSDCEDKTVMFPKGVVPWGNDWSPSHWEGVDFDTGKGVNVA